MKLTEILQQIHYTNRADWDTPPYIQPSFDERVGLLMPEYNCISWEIERDCNACDLANSVIREVALYIGDGIIDLQSSVYYTDNKDTCVFVVVIKTKKQEVEK